MATLSVLWNIDLSTRHGILVAGHFAIFYWMRYVVASATTGLSRFLRALILAPLLLLLGALFTAERKDEFVPAFYCGCLFLFLTPGTIYSFCMNRGQLVKAYDSGSTSAFVLTLLFPVAVKFRAERISKETEEKPRKHHPYNDVRFHVVRYQKEERTRQALTYLAHAIAKTASMVALRYARNLLRSLGYLFWSDICFGWFHYACSSVVQDFICLIVMIALNLKLEHSFDRPWLAQSIKELWSRRYNLVFGNVLRDIAYDPICESCCVCGRKYFNRRTPSKARKSIALCATFFASGIMHMYLFRFVYMSRTPFLMGLFFLANAPVILFEEWMKCIATTRKSYTKIARALPSWFFQIYCMSTIFALGHYLYLPELNSSGLPDAAVKGGLGFLPEKWDIDFSFEGSE